MYKQPELFWWALHLSFHQPCQKYLELSFHLLLLLRADFLSYRLLQQILPKTMIFLWENFIFNSSYLCYLTHQKSSEKLNGNDTFDSPFPDAITCWGSSTSSRKKSGMRSFSGVPGTAKYWEKSLHPSSLSISSSAQKESTF